MNKPFLIRNQKKLKIRSKTYLCHLNKAVGDGFIDITTSNVLNLRLLEVTFL
jgi:hypothetical protein